MPNSTDGLIRNVASLLTRRAQLASSLDEYDGRRDIDRECGYPDLVDAAQYRRIFDRGDLGSKIVNVYPEHCWREPPHIYDDEDVNIETPFETALANLAKHTHLFHFMARVDTLSGIGAYGVLLLGLSDGKDFDQPVVSENGPLDLPVSDGTDLDGAGTEDVELLELVYLRAFDESVIEIDQWEEDQRSPRYGLPILYSIKMAPPGKNMANTGESRTLKVHWHRVVHVADNRTTSEVMGTPRMQTVWNRLLDVRKITGGSAEMFWQGAFGGYAFENLDPENAEMDTEAIADEAVKFLNGLQRYLALDGVSAKSLSPTVASPMDHIDVQLKLIAATTGIPVRILIGSEAAHLASTQDQETWNERLMHRREDYLTPWLVRPVIDRLIQLGCLPPVNAEGYSVEWNDLNASTDADTATINKTNTEALSIYVNGGVDVLIPPMDYLTRFLGMEQNAAESVLKAAVDRMADSDGEGDTTDPLLVRQEQEAAAQAEAMAQLNDEEPDDDETDDE